MQVPDQTEDDCKRRIRELSEQVALLQSEKEESDMKKRDVEEENEQLVKSLQKLSRPDEPSDIGPLAASSVSGPLAESPEAQIAKLAEGKTAFQRAEIMQTRQSFLANTLMRFMENADWAAITNTLNTATDLTLDMVCTMLDGQGMTVLHHACRLQAEEYIKRFIEHAPAVVNWPSFSYPAKPACWTPLMC